MGDDTKTQGEDAAAGDSTTMTTTTTPKRKPWQRLAAARASRGAASTDGSGEAGDATGTAGTGGARGHAPDVAKVRRVVAQVIWAVCALFALILAVAVLLIAIEANASNDLVLWVINRADDVDLGFFSLTDPIKDWDKGETNPAEDVKTALFNYGIAAIVWLGIGKVLERVVKP